MHHLVPEGLDKIAADLGGASYGVEVDTKAPSSSGLATMLKRLVAPDQVESLVLSDSQSGDPWPDPLEGPALENEIAAGDRQVASGFSTTRPPARLAIVGWIWGKKVAMALQRDPSFERMLPRIGTSDNLMECHASDAHAQRALREGFLAPGLRFWVPGSGDVDESFSAVSDDGCARGVWRGRGTGSPMPKLADLPPDVDKALEPCHLVRRAKGTLRVKLETFGIEIVDVTSDGGDAEDRRCAEEALWAVALPDDFNQRRWGRTEYAFAVARSGRKDASP